MNNDGECQECSKVCETCEDAISCETYNKGIVEFFGRLVGCRKGCADCDPLNPEDCKEC